MVFITSHIVRNYEGLVRLGFINPKIYSFGLGRTCPQYAKFHNDHTPSVSEYKKETIRSLHVYGEVREKENKIEKSLSKIFSI